MEMIKRNFRQSQTEIDQVARAMELIGAQNESEYIRDAIRRRNKQIEQAHKRKGAAQK